jgi:phosphoglycerol transferase MdoB-like AlkP superfamily enzyme
VSTKCLFLNFDLERVLQSGSPPPHLGCAPASDVTSHGQGSLFSTSSTLLTYILVYGLTLFKFEPLIYTEHTQKNGAVLIVNTILTAPFFCVCPVYIYIYIYIASYLLITVYHYIKLSPYFLFHLGPTFPISVSSLFIIIIIISLWFINYSVSTSDSAAFRVRKCLNKLDSVWQGAV